MVSLEPCDLTTAEDAEALAQLALDTYGRIDILYNNAAKGEFAWFDEMSHEQFWKCMRQELDTVFLPTKAVWPHMVVQRGGAIVNTASMSATKVYEALPCVAHMTVKAAVQGFTRHLAFEGATVRDPGQHGRAGAHREPVDRPLSRRRLVARDAFLAGVDDQARRHARGHRLRGALPRLGRGGLRDGLELRRRRRAPVL